MDPSEFPDIEPHGFSASYTTIPPELLFPSFDFDILQQPFSLELQQLCDVATEDYLPPETVSHGPMPLEMVPDETFFDPNLNDLAQPPLPSTMLTDLSALQPNLLPEQYTVDAIEAELFQVVQPKRSAVMPLGQTASTTNLQPEPHAFDAMLSQDTSILQSQFQSNRSGLQQRAPKRGQKAATMSEQRWEPASDRIRQLYVVKGKPIKEVREIVNSEFGFTAT
jgi:Clr5 domain